MKLGEVPPTWEGSAIFVGDLYAIFYGEPEKTRQLQESVGGFFGYCGRLIPVLDLLFRGRDNVLILHEAPDPHTLKYFQDDLGLTLPDMVVLDHTIFPTFRDGLDASPEIVARLTRHETDLVDGYVTDPPLEEVAARLGKPLVNSYVQSRDANDKLALHRFMERAGLPAFDGGEVAPGRDMESMLAALKKQGYLRAVVRSSLGASGFGVATVALDDTRPHLPGHLTREEAVLVQGWVAPGVLDITEVTSPSVQFFIGDGGITLYDLTGQLLQDAAIHEGNVAPPTDLPEDPGVREEILTQSAEVVRWVASTGYRGTGSIDFLVYRQRGTVRVVTCEVNARVTGATYPALLARHFMPGQGWLMRNFGFAAKVRVDMFLAHMKKAGTLFLPGRDRGVLPINFIRDESGQVIKCQLLFLGPTAADCAALVGRAMEGLPGRSRVDRD